MKAVEAAGLATDVMCNLKDEISRRKTEQLKQRPVGCEDCAHADSYTLHQEEAGAGGGTDAATARGDRTAAPAIARRMLATAASGSGMLAGERCANSRLGRMTQRARKRAAARARDEPVLTQTQGAARQAERSARTEMLTTQVQGGENAAVAGAGGALIPEQAQETDIRERLPVTLQPCGEGNQEHVCEQTCSVKRVSSSRFSCDELTLPFFLV